MPISFNLDVTHLDKKRFVRGKSGKIYANMMLWECEEGSQSAEYGDFLVKQQGEKGDKMPILGNAKHVNFEKKKGGNNRGQRRDRDDEDDEIPF